MIFTVTSPDRKYWRKIITEHMFIVDGYGYTIPKDFEFDGASIPRIFWRIIGEPFDTKFIEASLVHDYLCRIRYCRKGADRKFRALLLKAKVKKWRATLMYVSVRAYAKIYNVK